MSLLENTGRLWVTDIINPPNTDKGCWTKEQGVSIHVQCRLIYQHYQGVDATVMEGTL